MNMRCNVIVSKKKKNRRNFTESQSIIIPVELDTPQIPPVSMFCQLEAPLAAISIDESTNGNSHFKSKIEELSSSSEIHKILLQLRKPWTALSAISNYHLTSWTFRRSAKIIPIKLWFEPPQKFHQNEWANFKGGSINLIQPVTTNSTWKCFWRTRLNKQNITHTRWMSIQGTNANL